MYSLYSATFRTKTSVHLQAVCWSDQSQYNTLVTLDEIRVITRWVKKKRTKNWSILMSILMSSQGTMFLFCQPWILLITKFLVPILKPLTTNELTVKYSFHFAEEIVNQQHDLFMGSLDVDSLFTNIPLEETIKICTNQLFTES